MQDLGAYLKALSATETSQDLWHLGVAYFKSIGIPMVTYHHVPPPGSPDYQHQTVTTEGFPKGWVDYYVRHRLFDFDPIPELAMSRSDPYRWSEISQLMSLNQDQRRYLDDLRNAELGDGLAIPVFGPGGRNGYVGLGFGSETAKTFTIVQLKELQWVCQATHMRLCEILAPTFSKDAVLAPREREVLQWIARGKSNNDISDIMRVSANTVDTYVRRIYRKLGVNDRVTAAVKGVGSGLVVAG